MGKAERYVDTLKILQKLRATAVLVIIDFTRRRCIAHGLIFKLTTMKVSELIETLNGFPENMDLVITDPVMEYVAGIRAVYYVDNRDEADRLPCSKEEATAAAILCDSKFSDLHG